MTKDSTEIFGHFLGNTYRVPEKTGSQVHEHLGEYYQRADNQLWEWVRVKSRYHDDWRPGNGTEDSEEGAKIKILEGWLTYREEQSQKLDVV